MEYAENNNFPFEIRDADLKLSEERSKHFTGEYPEFVHVGPKGYFLPKKFSQEEGRHIYNMPLRSDDVFVASYPRSGTTWTQELVWLVVKDLDYAAANATPLVERFPFLEESMFTNPSSNERLKLENIDSVRKLETLKKMMQPATEQLAEAPSPRFIKTHLPMSLLPPKLLETAKVVYVARDPRDVAVSFYHLNKLIKMAGYSGDLKTFWYFFVRDLECWAPYFDHLKEAWNMRHNPNMLFLFYEDLSKDLPAAVRKVTKFFNKQFTEQQVIKLCDHLNINNFKNNKSVNYDVVKELGMLKPGEQAFIRKGKSGGWRDHFDDDMTREAESWIADNLRDTDLRFPHMENL